MVPLRPRRLRIARGSGPFAPFLAYAILKPFKETAPELVATLGIGTNAASALLVAAGDNPGRLHSEAAFAHLCGASPLDASSGKKPTPPTEPKW